MKKSYLTIGGIVIAVVLLISVNILANSALRSKQVDLTEGKLYTLSEGTIQVLEKLEEPVTLRLFFSEKLANEQAILAPFKSYYTRLLELLQQYVAHSGGKLTLEQLDPEPFSEVEDKAVAAGLEGVPLPGTSDNFYFGLSGTGATDAEQVIPFFQPDREPTLEYDLTKLVYSLAHPKKLVVGVMSSLPIEGAMPNPFMPQREMPQPWYIMDQLRQLYEVKTVPPNAREIAKEINVLLLVFPKNIPPRTQYAIDQFVLGGGRIMVFVDPYCEADTPPADPQNPLAQMSASRAGDLPVLFKAWGLEMTPGQIAADRKSALRVNYSGSRGRDEAVDYVVWMNLTKDDFNQDEVLTNQLKSVRVATAGVLSKTDGATTQFTSLFETSTDSKEVPVSEIQFQKDPKTLLADFVPLERKLTLAARIAGPVKSAFPDGPPKEENVAEEDKAAEAAIPHLAESQGPILAIVVSDCDMLADRMWVQVQNLGQFRLGFPNADNGNFVANALDYMQGSTEMVSLRSRGGMARPFKVVDELRKDAEQRYRAEEQNLLAELDKAEQRLNELQAKKSGANTMILSPEQQAEIERIVQQKVDTRTKLRRVRHDLNADIERLGSWLKIVNIGVIPLLIGVLAVGMGAWRVQRRRSK